MSSHPEVATPPENSNSDFSVETLTTVLTFEINKELFLRVTASFKTNVIVILAINHQALLCSTWPRKSIEIYGHHENLIPQDLFKSDQPCNTRFSCYFQTSSSLLELSLE